MYIYSTMNIAINDSFLYPRMLNEDDIKYNYYMIMSMLPDNYRKLLHDNELLNNFEYKVIILENINTKIVVATISIRIGNTHSNLGKIGFIRDVILYDNYNFEGTHNPIISKELYEITMKNKDKLNDYINYDKDYLIVKVKNIYFDDDSNSFIRKYNIREIIG